MEKVIIAVNLKKYDQTKGACPLFDDPQLYLYIGDFGEGPHVEAILDVTSFCPDNTYPEVKNSSDTYNAQQLFQIRNP